VSFLLVLCFSIAERILPEMEKIGEFFPQKSVVLPAMDTSALFDDSLGIL
jgi:hypothetical protein